VADPRSKKADVDAVARLAERLGRTRRRYRDIRWPGGELIVRLYVPPEEERQFAKRCAIDRLREIGLPVTALTADALDEESAMQLLAMCLQDPQRPLAGAAGAQGRCEPLESADVLRGTIDADERTAFVVELADLIREVDPRLYELSPADRAAVDDALKKKDESRLRSFGSSALARYLITSESRPAT
jgi:hypothetical protein